MKRSAGFTLVELMVVLAIVAVLCAIAYPSYTAQVAAARRVEGQAALMETMQQQERYFTRNNSYIAFSSDSIDPQALRFKWWSGSSAGASAYELSARACPGQAIAECVELQAIPGTAKVDAKFRDGDCATLSLTSAGDRAASGSSQHCWP